MAADNDDIKAKMRAALDKKNAANQPADSDVGTDSGAREKAHGPEVAGAVGPKMHRRKSGGGGS